jgi:hypothetical protein
MGGHIEGRTDMTKLIDAFRNFAEVSDQKGVPEDMRG